MMWRALDPDIQGTDCAAWLGLSAGIIGMAPAQTKWTEGEKREKGYKNVPKHGGNPLQDGSKKSTTTSGGGLG